MLYRDICKILGFFLYGFAATLTIPLAVALYYLYYVGTDLHPQQHTAEIFLETILICLCLAIVCHYIGRHASGRLYRKEALASVAIIWFLSSGIAALPFYLSGTLSNPFHAYFEAASGLTTTGSTMMVAKEFDSQGHEIPIHRDVAGVHPTTYTFYGTIYPVIDQTTGKVLYKGIEAVSKALLFWRSFIQWLGGIGIVVLFVAILPFLGMGGKVLFNMEMPGPIKDSLTPRIKETAALLWKIYFAMTVAQVILLLYTNPEMDLFNATCIAFSTLSTGGFCAKNDSIAAFHSAWTDWIVILFMFLGSVNFAIYYHALRGKFYRAYEPEFLLYLAIILITGGLSAWYIVGTPNVHFGLTSEGVYNWHQAIRYAFFQLISAQSTTGFITADFDVWPYAVQALLIIVMFIGGMAGSTAGGTKVIRHYMVFRIIQNKIETLFRPDTIRQFRLGNREVDSNTSIWVMCFLAIFVAFSVLGTFLYIVDGVDPETALGLVACMINNTGFSFRAAGPYGSCAFLSNFGCAMSSVLMILGRLEFFAVLAILVPSFWKQT